MSDISKRLWKYSEDYYAGKSQDFEQLFKDCVRAADMLKIQEMANTVASMPISEGTSKSVKLCEIKVDRKDSLQELVYHLTANGYRVDTAVVWKEYPQSGIDYWMIAIFDKEEK